MMIKIFLSNKSDRNKQPHKGPAYLVKYYTSSGGPGSLAVDTEQ